MPYQPASCSRGLPVALVGMPDSVPCPLAWTLLPVPVCPSGYRSALTSSRSLPGSTGHRLCMQPHATVAVCRACPEDSIFATLSVTRVLLKRCCEMIKRTTEKQPTRPLSSLQTLFPEAGLFLTAVKAPPVRKAHLHLPSASLPGGSEAAWPGSLFAGLSSFHQSCISTGNRAASELPVRAFPWETGEEGAPGGRGGPHGQQSRSTSSSQA